MVRRSVSVANRMAGEGKDTSLSPNEGSTRRTIMPMTHASILQGFMNRLFQTGDGALSLGPARRRHFRLPLQILFLAALL